MIKEKELLIKDVLRTIVYFDVFNYPLTCEQVHNFLPRNSVTQKDISSVLEEMEQKKIITRDNNYYCLGLSDKKIGVERKENELRAMRLIKYARFVTQLLKRFPFVRGVFITGSLSKNVATKESDIDFMVVTEPRRLWVCKTMLTLFRKFFLLGSHKYLCSNYYVSEMQYQYPEHNIFTAIEIVTTKVAWNANAHRKFIAANPWVQDFLPNYGRVIDHSVIVDENRVRFQKILEAILSFLPLTRIDSALMNYFSRHWERKYYYLKTKNRDSQFRTTPDVSSVWKKDQQKIILDRYNNKLFELELL